MPRYYFHLTDGNQVLNNHRGIDLSGNAAARDDALVLAQDLKHGAVMAGCAGLRRAAVFVDKILKGARPVDLPIEQPTLSAISRWLGESRCRWTKKN